LIKTKYQNMTAIVKPVTNTPRAILGEGSIWHPAENVLYWIDITGEKLHRYDPEKEENQTVDMGSMIGTVVPSEGKYSVVVALETGIFGIGKNGEKELLHEYPDAEPSDNRFNDGKCDPAGRFWIGTMSKKETKGAGNLYSFNGKELRLKQPDVTISNGIVWSADTKTMYYIDTPEMAVFAYDFNKESGEISNRRIAFKVPETLGYPDGMSIDEEDMLWIALWNGAAVIRFNPATGEVLEKIELPALNVTSCAFGGEELKTLYITTAKQGMTEKQLEQYPLAGSLFVVECEVKGTPANMINQD
jgi:sugar lactone lactonase YvrE